MAIPILKIWKNYFVEDRNEGLGSSYERVVLNLKLEEIRKHYTIQSALEVPIFGFTGLSGINSMGLAKKHVSMHLIDNDRERLDLIQDVWNEANVTADFICQEKFEHLPFADTSIDFAWNFSAMWFLEDMETFLKELTRVISKVILICVPNRSGFGYLSQKYISGADLRKLLREDFIIPHNIITSLQKLGWKLIDGNYIDCPPWPDIGMAKEDFLKLMRMEWLLRFFNKGGGEPAFYSIMDYYMGKNPNFEQEMLKYAWVEKYGPRFVKYFWAHHKYFLFESA